MVAYPSIIVILYHSRRNMDIHKTNKYMVVSLLYLPINKYDHTLLESCQEETAPHSFDGTLC